MHWNRKQVCPPLGQRSNALKPKIKYRVSFVFFTSLFACWRARSSDGLSLFVSSTDGYVSKIHFKEGELGSFIPKSDVPLQTKRLHPVIYGWQPEAAGTDDISGRIPTLSPPATGSCVLRECHASTQQGVDGGNGVVLGEASAKTPSPGIVATKAKKKIVPTLVTSLPVAVSKHDPKVNNGQVTRLLTGILPRPTPSVDELQSERKKRRIAPTLVHSDLVTARVQSADGVVTVVNEVPSISSTAGDSASRIPQAFAKSPSESSQDQNPKKKRLAPTLVSAL